jgi:hypothetical protein
MRAETLAPSPKTEQGSAMKVASEKVLKRASVNAADNTEGLQEVPGPRLRHPENPMDQSHLRA